MAALLYRLLNCRERRPFSLRGRALTLALLPAQELLAARLAGETAEDPLEGALHGSAPVSCLLRVIAPYQYWVMYLRTSQSETEVRYSSHSRSLPSI